MVKPPASNGFSASLEGHMALAAVCAWPPSAAYAAALPIQITRRLS